MYAIEVIESEEQLAARKDEWEAFLRDAPAHEYHHHPANIGLLLRHLYTDTSLRVFLIRKEGTLCCIAPFSLERSHFNLKFGTVTLWNNAVHQYTLLGTRIVFATGADPGPCLGILAEELRGRRDEYDLIFMESLSYGSPLYTIENPLPGFSIYPISIHKNVVRGLRTSDSFSEYLATLRKKRRYNLKRSVRMLERAAGKDYRVERITGAAQVEGFLEAVDYIFVRCWQRHTHKGYRHLTDGNVAYHQGLANLGWLRSYLLYCKQQPVAYVIGYQYRGRYYYEYIGYDQAWAEFSPGTILTFLMIEDIHTVDRPEILDFGFGENVYKQIFGNYSYEANNSYLVLRDSRMRIAAQAQLELSRVYCSIYPALVKCGLDRPIRKVLRRIGR
ncbi:MAG TPA: GNAT family N-acetyltransferase [Gammaproteobacteria bacterium]|nr:GNAT family N-acetyltransferase [Gammaproteobacteria bacterium]